MTTADVHARAEDRRRQEAGRRSSREGMSATERREWNLLEGTLGAWQRQEGPRTAFRATESTISRASRAAPLALRRSYGQNSRLIFGASKSVANIKSAEKRARQTIKRRAQNMASRSKLRTAIKSVMHAVEQGDKDVAAQTLKVAGPVIDSAVNKGLIHRNKASRHKSQLNARVKALAQAG